jgi:uncharacterized protein (DUF433 family)
MRYASRFFETMIRELPCEKPVSHYRFSHAVGRFLMTEDRWQTSPLYTITEAAKLAEVSSVTVRRWLQEYETPSGPKSPIFGESHDAPLVSFLQLVEIVVAKGFRNRNVSLERVRQAHLRARNMYGVTYPFARLQLRAWGGHIISLMERGGGIDSSLEVLDTEGLRTLPGLVQAVIESLDYEDDLAARWYPMGKDVPIVIDPRHVSGEPTIPGRNVTIAGISKRFEAGQSIKLIADDLVLTPTQVEDVLRYRVRLAA